jgi:hypothetical protein
VVQRDTPIVDTCPDETGPDTALPATLSIEVQRWTPMRGRLHQFTTVVADTPQPPPRDADEWHRWSEALLTSVAERDAWQSGRYHYRVQTPRDPDRIDADPESGAIIQDHWEYSA